MALCCVDPTSRFLLWFIREYDKYYFLKYFLFENNLKLKKFKIFQKHG
jgi:hypothetical protein